MNRIVFLLLRVLGCAVAGLALAGSAQARLPPTNFVVHPTNLARAADYNGKCDGVSLLVMHEGRVIFEDYPTRYHDEAGPETAWLIASGTKSFSGGMATALIADGMMTSFDELVSDTITEWKWDTNYPAKAGITIRQLLSLTSGVDADYWPSPPPYALAITAPLVAGPGTSFEYGPVPFQIFGEVVRRKLTARGVGLPTPDPVVHYLRARILDPIGCVPAGWNYAAPHDPFLPQGAQFTARLWAPYGELIRRGGIWTNGPELLPQAVLEECFVGSTPRPSYGLTRWLDTDPNNAVPDDLVSALGAGGQHLYVSRSLGLVVVRQTGETSPSALLAPNRSVYKMNRFFSLLLNGVTPRPDSDEDLIPDDRDDFPSNPVEWLDEDNDGLGYNFELRLINAATNDALRTTADVLPDDDFDGDGLTNGREFEIGADPTVADARVVVSRNQLTVSEGATANFTVRLSQAPAGEVVVFVARTSGDADLSIVTSDSLTFRPLNWTVPQSVTLAAADDPDIANGTALFTCAAPGFAPALATATESDRGALRCVATANPWCGLTPLTVSFQASASGGVPVYWFSVKRRLAEKTNALWPAVFCFGLIRERLGDSVPEPLGFFALLSIPQEAGLGSRWGCPSLRYSSPPRRSSCFPAEPYPPSGRSAAHLLTARCQALNHEPHASDGSWEPANRSADKAGVQALPSGRKPLKITHMFWRRSKKNKAR